MEPLREIGTIQILYYSDCPHYVETIWDVKKILSEERLSADIKSVDLARSPEMEKEIPFAGSPDTRKRQGHRSGGRSVFRSDEGQLPAVRLDGKVYDYSHKELTKEALTSKSRGKEKR